MIKVLSEVERDSILYTCREGDTIDSIARRFGTSLNSIKDSNPLFSGVYEGCILLLENISKSRITVEPLESIESIAEKYGTTVERIMKLTNLKSAKVFVGMQLLIDDKS